MFPTRQNFTPSVYFSPVLRAQKQNGSTFYDTFEVDNCQLPNPENFSLDKMVKANIPMQQVNTKIIDSPVLDLGSMAESVESSTINNED